MFRWHLRVYVGPTLVQSMAEKFRDAGLHVRCEGTAHVHVDVETDVLERSAGDRVWRAWRAFALALVTRHGTNFGLGMSDLHMVRQVVESKENEVANA